MQDSILFFRSFAARKSFRNNAGFLGILPPPRVYKVKNVSPLFFSLLHVLEYLGK